VIRETTLRDRALRLLARREHSRVELQRKLTPFSANPEELDTLLDELTNRRLLSEDRYAEERSRVLSRRYGSARIAHDLKTRGVSDEVVERTVAEARRTDLDRAREVWRKRFGEVARSREERAKQMRFLQSRGFSMDVINQVIRGAEEGNLR
jgi:regulatory protein